MSGPIWYWRRLEGSYRQGLYVVTLRGENFGVPRRSLWAILAYLHRVRMRYPEGLPEVEASQKGGPWRWRHEGRTGVIQCSRKEDAITTLRHALRRTRLPRGLTWELTRG